MTVGSTNPPHPLIRLIGQCGVFESCESKTMVGPTSKIQTPPSTRRSRPCSRTSLQLTSKRHRAPQLGYLSYLGRQLLTPITHWMERTCKQRKKDKCGMRGWVSAAEFAACDEG